MLIAGPHVEIFLNNWAPFPFSPNIYEVQSRSNAYIFIVTVQELLLQPC